MGIIKQLIEFNIIKINVHPFKMEKGNLSKISET